MSRSRAACLFGLLAISVFVVPRCSDQFDFQGVLAQSISIHTVEGLPIVPAEADDEAELSLALDFGSALTTLDLPDGAAGEERIVTLKLREAPEPGEAVGAGRMVFPQVNARLLEAGSTRLGLGSGFPVHGSVGADLLSHFAVELDLRNSRMRFFDELPGTSGQLAAFPECLAVLKFRRRGGGVEEGSSCAERVSPTRVTFSACIEDAAQETTTALAQTLSGREAEYTLALSTAVAPVVLSESSFRRLRFDSATGAASECEETVLNLPTGPVNAACRTTVARVSLVSNEDANQGPCGEAERRRRDTVARAATASVQDVEVVVIPDRELTALRTELGAATPTVDGFLGTSFLAPFVATVDYRHSRLTLRCVGASCHHCVRLPRGEAKSDCDPAPELCPAEP